MEIGRRNEPDGQAQILVDEANGLSEIRVVRDDNRALDKAAMCVVQEVRGKVDVRALLLGPEHLLIATPVRTRQRHSVGEKLP
jgi:hypothetical protein